MAKLQGGTTVYGLLSTSGVIYASGGNSDQWNNTYTIVNTTSSSWNNKLALSGGTLTGGLIGTTSTFTISISAPALSGVHYGDGSKLTGIVASGGTSNDPNKLPLSGGTINGNLLINGGLTALSGATFINTIFRDTSALKIYNSGLGPALYVEQAAGSGDIANFYDADGIEVLHVGNALNPESSGVIGIKTSTPNKTLTINGEVSAASGVWASIYYGDGSQLTNVVAAGGIATDSTKLPLTGGIISGALTITGTFSTTNTDNWQTTYTTVCANSTQWAVTIDNTKLPLSGGTLTGGLTGTTGLFTNSLSSPSISATIFYGDGSKLTGIIAAGGVATDNTKLPLSGGTLTGGLTGTIAYFSGVVYGSTATVGVSTNQLANTAFVYDSLSISRNTNTFLNTNSGKWESTYTNVSSNSGIWNGTYTTVNSNSSVWNNVIPLSTTVTSLVNLTSNFNNTYNTVNSNSSNWNNTYNTVSSISSKWESTYSILNSNSGSWNSTYTTVNSNSGKWESVYTTVNLNSSSYVTLTATQKLENKTIVDWMTLVRGYNTTPTLNTTIPTGDVYNYVYNSSPSNITYYRFIATDGSTDAFYTYFSGTTLSGLVASKSIII